MMNKKRYKIKKSTSNFFNNYYFIDLMNRSLRLEADLISKEKTTKAKKIKDILEEFQSMLSRDEKLL